MALQSMRGPATAQLLFENPTPSDQTTGAADALQPNWQSKEFWILGGVGLIDWRFRIRTLRLNCYCCFLVRVKMMLSMKKTSYSWWFDSHSSQRRSPWLQSTISELDEKILAMLKLIEEDADSFAESAEMYCKKRPELVNMVEGLYRAHRSLAEQFDQLKLESGIRQITPPGCPFNGRYQTCKLRRDGEISYDSYSDAFDFEDSGESEVDDPEQEEITQAQGDREMREEEVSSRAGDSVSEIMKLRKELERLKEENRIQTDQLMEKDEKREVIRQLSLSVEVMKKESTDLRKTAAKAKGLSKGSLFELGMLKAAFSQ